MLCEQACSVRAVSTGREAISHVERGVDLVMVGDLPDGDGLSIMQQLRQIDPSCPVMLMTSRGSVEHAVTALRLGATDYARKPISPDAVRRFVREAVGAEGASTRGARTGIETLLGSSSSIRRVRTLLRRLAQTPRATVLLVGETGTGKRRAARALHEEDAAGGPFLSISCSARPPAALESDLFGVAADRSSAVEGMPGLLERAEGGTLLLDDIDHLPPELQNKLVATLNDGVFRRVGGSIDVPLALRLVTATKSQLRAAVRSQRFRADLYYRLALCVIEMPPLRDRLQDIEPLARHFLLNVSRRELRPPPILDAGSIVRLRSHAWPGNVRELRNVLESATLLHRAPRLPLESIDLPGPESALDSTPLDLPPSGIDLRQFERRMVEQALRRAGGNITRAAGMLGLNRDQMRYRVAKFGLQR